MDVDHESTTPGRGVLIQRRLKSIMELQVEIKAGVFRGPVEIYFTRTGLSIYISRE